MTAEDIIRKVLHGARLDWVEMYVQDDPREVTTLID